MIIGGNGSGKSTFLKLLIGDLESEEGDAGTMWRHHSLRLSYVAQQSLHHLEDFVQLTPIHYIQERFRTGLDKEVAKLKTLAITPEEEEEMSTAGAIRGVVGRKQKGKMVEYELCFSIGSRPKPHSSHPKSPYTGTTCSSCRCCRCHG